MSTEIEGSAAWWLAQDCGTLGDRLIGDMDRIASGGSGTAEEYTDAAFAVFVPAVRSRDEEIERIRAERDALKVAIERVSAIADRWVSQAEVIDDDEVTVLADVGRTILAALAVPESTGEAPRQDVESLIEQSSLGTPAAKALRDSVAPEAVARVLARVKELEAEATPDATTEGTRDER